MSFATPGEDISMFPSSCFEVILTMVFFHMGFFLKVKKNGFGLGKGVCTQGVKEVRKGTKNNQIFFNAREKKEKKIPGSCVDVSGHFSSSQWKGGGIDGRVSPWTGDSDRIVLTHDTGYASRLVWCGDVSLPRFVEDDPWWGQDSLMT